MRRIQAHLPFWPIVITSVLIYIIVVYLKKWGINDVRYFVFTVSFFVLFWCGFIKPFSEFIFLLNIFLILGFWGKATVHIITGQDFVDAHANLGMIHLNRAMITSSGLAILLVLFQILLRILTLQIPNVQIRPKAYFWKILTRWKSFFENQSRLISILTTVCIVLIALLNWKVSFFRVGLVPETKITFPFSLVISWVLGPGAAFLLFLALGKKKQPLFIFLVALSMSAISITTLSRNALMYFSYPVSVGIFKSWKDYKNIILTIIVLLPVFIFSMIKISQVRLNVLGKLPQAESLGDLSRTKVQVKQVFLDRWVGIEGALVAERYRSDNIFMELIFEDNKTNPVSRYQSLAESDFTKSEKFTFNTYPGPIGLLGFSESLNLRLIAFAVYCFLIGVTYLVLGRVFSGSVLSLVSWWGAANLSQISLYPIFGLKIYCVYLFAMALLAFIWNPTEK